MILQYPERPYEISLKHMNVNQFQINIALREYYYKLVHQEIIQAPSYINEHWGEVLREFYQNHRGTFQAD